MIIFNEDLYLVKMYLTPHPSHFRKSMSVFQELGKLLQQKMLKIFLLIHYLSAFYAFLSLESKLFLWLTELQGKFIFLLF